MCCFVFSFQDTALLILSSLFHFCTSGHIFFPFRTLHCCSFHLSLPFRTNFLLLQDTALLLISSFSALQDKFSSPSGHSIAAHFIFLCPSGHIFFSLQDTALLLVSSFSALQNTLSYPFRTPHCCSFRLSLPFRTHLLLPSEHSIAAHFIFLCPSGHIFFSLQDNALLLVSSFSALQDTFSSPFRTLHCCSFHLHLPFRTQQCCH